MKFELDEITRDAAPAYLRLDKAGEYDIIQWLGVAHDLQELEKLVNCYALVGEVITPMQSSDSMYE